MRRMRMKGGMIPSSGLGTFRNEGEGGNLVVRMGRRLCAITSQLHVLGETSS